MADDGRDIYVTLGDGAVFGEVCISFCTLRILYLVLSFEGSVFGTVFGEVWIYSAHRSGHKFGLNEIVLFGIINAL